MKGQSTGIRKKAAVNIILCAFAVFELFICVSIAGSKKNSLEYGLEYEKSPLLLKQVVITNRQELSEDFDLYEDEELYEVCFTYENPAAYVGRFYNELHFEAVESGYGVFMVHPQGEYGIARQSDYNQVVPAGKTGSFTCFISAPVGTGSIRITENGRKLSGKGEKLTVQLPENAGESAGWNASE